MQNTTKASKASMQAQIIACVRLSVPAARGRVFVRSTCRSKSLSAMSLMMQPKPLMRKAPAIKSAAYIRKRGRGASVVW